MHRAQPLLWSMVICNESDGLQAADTGPDPQTQAEQDALESKLDGLIAAETGASADMFAGVEDEISENGVDQEPDVVESDGPCIANAGFIRGWHVRGLPDGFDPNTPADGVWRARWRDVTAQHHGYVHGLWMHREPPTDDPNGITDPNGPPDPNAPVDPNAPAPGPDGGMHHPRVLGTFVGRVFNDNDQPIGVIRGVYGFGRHRIGVFHARFFDLDDQPAGVLRGRWDNAPGRRGGPLFGTWVRIDGSGAGGTGGDSGAAGTGGDSGAGGSRGDGAGG